VGTPGAVIDKPGPNSYKGNAKPLATYPRQRPAPQALGKSRATADAAAAELAASQDPGGVEGSPGGWLGPLDAAGARKRLGNNVGRHTRSADEKTSRAVSNRDEGLAAGAWVGGPVSPLEVSVPSGGLNAGSRSVAGGKAGDGGRHGSGGGSFPVARAERWREMLRESLDEAAAAGADEEDALRLMARYGMLPMGLEYGSARRRGKNAGLGSGRGMRRGRGRGGAKQGAAATVGRSRGSSGSAGSLDAGRDYVSPYSQDHLLREYRQRSVAHEHGMFGGEQSGGSAGPGGGVGVGAGRGPGPSQRRQAWH